MSYGPHFPKRWNSDWGKPPSSWWKYSTRETEKKSGKRKAMDHLEEQRSKRRAEADDRGYWRTRKYKEKSGNPDVYGTSVKRKRTDSSYGSSPNKKYANEVEYNRKTIDFDNMNFENTEALGSIVDGINTASQVAAAVGSASRIANSDTPWSTAGSEAGSFVGSIVGSEFGPIGSLIGSELGSIAGSVIGSAGDSASEWLFPQQKNMPKAGFAPFNSGKSSATSKGRVKVAASNKRVKVSKKLREKVKAVLKGQLPQGVYRFNHQGFIGIETTDTVVSAEKKYTCLTEIGTTVDVARASPPLLNSKMWFAGYCTTQNNANGNDKSFAAQGLFNYFTPTKFLNAASILFNGKAMPDSTTVLNTDNMLLNVDDQGAIIQAPRKYKLHINDSRVTLAFKNCAARVMIVDFYVCTMKMRTGTVDGLKGLTEPIVEDSFQSGSFTSLPPFKARTSNDKEEVINYTLTSHSFDPAMLPTFRARYKYEKLTLTIQPGETMTKTIQGPKNYDLDYSKIIGIGNNAPDSDFNYKPTTVVCFASVRPDQQFCSAGINASDTLSGSVQAVKGILNLISCPISITQEQYYDMSMPESTGFQYQATTTPGQHQTLNSRFSQKRIYINDRRIAVDQAKMSYPSVNEENPAVNNVISSANIIY